jgi:hypothetical protein
MSELLSVLLSFPTVVYTGLLGLVLLYWIFVILGALDIDLFHADADVGIEGAAKGAFEGAAKAGAEGIKGAFEAAGKAGAEAAADAIDGHGLDHGHDVDADAGGAAGILNALSLRRAPVTVTFSLIVFFSWVLSYLATTLVGPAATVVLPTWLFSTITLFGTFALSLPLTSLATKPMERVFQTTTGKKRIEFVGSVCEIRTGSVNDGFGQAEIADGGAGQIIQVRSADGALKRGDRALIIDFDREREAYIVEAYDSMLDEQDEAAQRARKRS